MEALKSKIWELEHPDDRVNPPVPPIDPVEYDVAKVKRLEHRFRQQVGSPASSDAGHAYMHLQRTCKPAARLSDVAAQLWKFCLRGRPA